MKSYILISTLILNSCGQQDDSQNTPATQPAAAAVQSYDFNGSFSSGCFQGIILTMTNKDSVSTTLFKEFENRYCTGKVLEETTYIRPYAIVGNDGKGVYFVDITQDGEVFQRSWHGSSLGVSIDLGLRYTEVQETNARETAHLQIVMQKL